MIGISDYVYERSVRKQLSFLGEKGASIRNNGSEASIVEVEEGSFAEASFSKFFRNKEEVCLLGGSLLSLKRKFLCAGSSLRSLRAEFYFFGKFSEETLRVFTKELGLLCEKEDLILRGVSVRKREEGEKGFLLTLLGEGAVKSVKDAPWQKNILLPSQGIVITGSIGRAGSLKLFKAHEEEVSKAFPKVFVEKMRKRVADRLPYLELENAPFFGVTALSPGEEGGLLAALYRLGDREEAGFRIYADRLLYDQATIELAEYFDKNPLELSSEGVYVMAVARAEDFVESLRASGLPAVLAGEVTEEKKRVILFGEEERFIESPRF